MKYCLLLLLNLFSIYAFSQQDSLAQSIIVTPDGDIILPEVSIETVDIADITTWKTSYFYELTEENHRYALKNGTKQELKRKIILNGTEKTLCIYGEKNRLKMHQYIEDVIRSENQLIVNFRDGSYMIIDSNNKTISLFKTNFGFVYKIEK